MIGEGSGIVVLEELEHAKARGANIYAELVGYGATGDAYHITSPAEDGSGAAKAMLLAMEEAGIRQKKLPTSMHMARAHITMICSRRMQLKVHLVRRQKMSSLILQNQ